MRYDYIILPIKNSSNILLSKNNKQKYADTSTPNIHQILNGTLKFNKIPICAEDDSKFQNYHLYIISDETVIEGDYFIELDLNGTRSSYCNKPYLCDVGNTGGFILTKKNGNFPFPKNCRKIIASTDTSIDVKLIPRNLTKFIIDNYNSISLQNFYYVKDGSHNNIPSKTYGFEMSLNNIKKDEWKNYVGNKNVIPSRVFKAINGKIYGLGFNHVLKNGVELMFTKHKTLAVMWWDALSDFGLYSKHTLCTKYFKSKMFQNLEEIEIEKIYYDQKTERNKMMVGVYDSSDESKYFIGVDFGVAKDDNICYTMFRKIGKNCEVILNKQFHNDKDKEFNEEIMNLSKYFNAEIIKQ